MQKAIITILFILFGLIGKTQITGNLRTKSITLPDDTIFVDTLSIVPGSEIIFDNNKKIIPDTLYSFDHLQGILILPDSIRANNFAYPLVISYRVFPVNFSEPWYHRKKEETIIVGPVLAYPDNKKYNYRDNILNDNQLDKRGSIARGITVGNNQNAVINSNLNMQISGKLSNDLYILAAISDENIPIQADGNSQQIQDFDKVFIKLYNNKTSLIAGDFEINKPTGHFMNLNRKVQGGLLETSFDNKKNIRASLKSTISGAISKGKYCRQTFQGQEGNQGPYKLKGCENEQYIIVLSGTEKVYINGQVLTRGKDYDYVIDYNTGEITFTAGKPVTKDSRIAVEFEYSERSYSRYMIYSTNEFKTKNGNFWLNIYSEKDSKNQPINQDLTNEQKQYLSESGDSIENAYVLNVDSTEFKNDYVLYEKKDTLVNGIVYGFYQYSTNPEKAVYYPGFSQVGENKGNYVQIQNSANGRVFEWVAPAGAIPQGNYEPVRLLISPKKHQMISFGGNINLNPTSLTNFEFALSNYDINTFSERDASDNIGYALKLAFQKSLLNSDTTLNLLKTNINWQLLNKNFKEIERFRTVEFERDWNIIKPFSNDEHLAELGILYRRKKTILSNYTFSLLTDNNEYTAYKNKLDGSLNKSGYSVYLNSGILNTNSGIYETQFIRYLAGISKSFSVLESGIEHEMEQNKWNNTENDSLVPNSFSFTSYRFFIKSPDSLINKYSASYTLRSDFLPVNNSLMQSTESEDFQIGFALLKNPSNILKTNINYRKLLYTDTTIIKGQQENTLTGRINYNFRLFKGAISSSVFYEAGTGLEPKREFSYLKVATGQGIYTWEDYNNNGIAELDEFEVAQFQDQASYIRIYSPGTEYIKTYKNEFSQILSIRPAVIWKNKTGLRKILSRFSNNLAWQINQKTTDEMPEHSLNPFYTSNDSTIINTNQNIRNTFSFNRISSKFGIDYIYQKNINSILLSNGFDKKNRYLNRINVRWKFADAFVLTNSFESGRKKYESEFFSIKNFDIEAFIYEIKIRYQPGYQTRSEINYSYSDKKNVLFVENCFINNLGAEINYSVTKKGNLLVKGNYLNINYNSDPNTSVAYEMLQALKPGHNATWNILFQRKIAENLEMNFNYNGRISENINAIHTGSLQLRAFF
ncbi:MAG: hypothetical protein KOO66_04255 [Bacteroidales bacterium]|nr:hypothetical protein [Bacteroidales bacterium]